MKILFIKAGNLYYGEISEGKFYAINELSKFRVEVQNVESWKAIDDVMEFIGGKK